MKLEAFILKLIYVRRICLGNIFTIFLTMMLLFTINVNTLFVGFFVYILALCIVCFFTTNTIIDKYKDLSGEFQMSKEDFVSFFDNGYLLKTILYSLMPITVWGWAYLIINSGKFIIYLSLLDSFLFIIIGLYLGWATRQLVNSFIVAISLARVIEYVCKNDLIKNKG